MSDISKRDLPISSGVNYLKDGYIDYAEEVITERAIVNLYDGLKPVNRKILWTLKNDMKGDKRYIKSQTAAGHVLTYHPHNDTAIYLASVTMTDNNGFSNFPLLDGYGNFGGYGSGETAAASRYTEMKLHSNSSEFFKGLDGVTFMPNHDATATEPTVLPVSFPYVLVNPSEGIAVGFSSKIPSFNFNDVIDLTVEYLRDGHCHSVIAPDFSTGGYYVQNNKELKKLMEVGKASLKLRARGEVHDKDIVFTEVPFGRSVAKLCAEINSKDIDGISSVSNLCDFNGIKLEITCKSKQRVNDVMYYLWKDTDLQYNYKANLTVVQDGVPKTMGVYRIIEEWCKWRSKLVEKDLKSRVVACKERMGDALAFMNLINSDKKEEFVQIVISQGRDAGSKFIMENFSREDIPEDKIQFVSSRSLNLYHTGGKYATEYQNAQMELRSCEKGLADINAYMIDQLTTLKKIYGASQPRRTEVTLKDYEFAKKEEVETVDNSACWFALKDNFLRKYRYEDKDNDFEYVFKGNASDTLIAFDNWGRLLRIYAKDIPTGSSVELGTYLPRYLDIEADDDYKIMWLGKVDGSTKMLLYGDGNVGFIDTSEFLNTKRNIRVLQNGIHEEAYNVVHVFDELPEVLMVTDNEGKLSWVKVSEIKRKSRTARTRVFNVKRDNKLVGYMETEEVKVPLIIKDSELYQAPSVKNLQNPRAFDIAFGEFLPM